MGNTAEDVAEKYQITREHRDEFAVASRRKAGEAIAVRLKGRDRSCHH